MFNRSILVALAAATSLAACSGDAGSSALPTSRPTSAPSQQPIQTATMTLHVRKSATTKASSNQRRPDFVSPAAGSITIQLISFNGAYYSSGETTPLVLALSGPACTTDGTTQTCALTMPGQPIGNDIYAIVAYENNDGTGNVLGANEYPAGITVQPAPAVNATARRVDFF